MTIKDLSAQTGYSVGTISRVLNKQPNVSEKARKIILQAADEYGFQLNTNAKQLKQQRGTSILVIARGRSNELFGRLVELIQTRIAKTNYPLVVDYIDETDNEVRRALQLCRELKPLGILFLGGNQKNFLADFGKISVPAVLVTSNARDLPFPNLSSVSSDDALAAEMAINHLVRLGHKRIVVVGGDLHASDITKLRYEGCLKAFQAHGIEFKEQDYEPARFSYADGYLATKALLRRGRNFTALFAMSDVMAIGAIRALRDAGKQVPKDVSVIGLDGLVIGEYTIPKLATVCQSVDDLGNKSWDLLMEQVENEGSARHETIPVFLEWRESAIEIR